MSIAVHSKNLQIFNAEQFLESVSEPADTKLYLTFGRSEPWPNDAAPTQANSSISTANEVWSNMIGGKRITGNDMQHVIIRHDWQSGENYSAYDHCSCSLILFDANTQFYVMTSDYGVYKCLANNNGGISTIMPTRLDTSGVINESDGYIWKYMYTVSPSEQLKFTTSSYIPVKTLTADDSSLQWDVQQNAISGGIEVIKVINGGTNYTSNDNISISVSGDGVGANAFAQINSISNTISTIYVDNPGTGYTSANVTISTTGAGSNASFRAIISPPNGHGSDPISELGGSFIMLNPRLQGEESGILLTDHEYRQISIMRDPISFGSSSISSNTVFSQVTKCVVSGVSADYIKNELVYQGTNFETSSFKGRVVEWDSANGTIMLSNVVGIPSSDILIGINSGATRFINSVTNPDMKPYSGKLLYIDNISSVERSTDQTEDFKIVLKF